MARINLLPWREAHREEKKKEFVSAVVVVAIFAGLITFAWISAINSQIDAQKSRNLLLNTELTKLKTQVKEVDELRKKRADLVERMNVIQGLQGKRPAIVHVFDQFANAIPDGVYIVSLTNENEVISLQGIAESNQRVSTLMRNLNNSDWFVAPNLTSVKAGGDLGEQSSTFSMTVKVSDPKTVKDDEAV